MPLRLPVSLAVGVLVETVFSRSRPFIQKPATWSMCQKSVPTFMQARWPSPVLPMPAPGTAPSTPR